eukprot:Phypoly_transcript_15939.p1 GENE.Phypoly_transcript_15939~~Phypoly_transcript_15939.p1  ORF type:complete len:282 (+),score=36.57 Phypoly_transcript_15939:85-846(+)
MKKALFHAFPNIGLNASKFLQVPARYWQDIGNRRKFLENYAKEHKFDPLNPTNWYTLSLDVITRNKKAGSVLWFYKKSLVKALLHLFPEIGLDAQQFSYLPQKFWQNIDNRRSLLEQFAKHKKFDPLIASNWYSVMLHELHSFKKIDSALALYRGSVVDLLCHLFPEIGLDPEKFALRSNGWEYARNRRQFFVDFAGANQFNPYVSENWYSQQSALLKIQGSKQVLSYYRSNLAQALSALFPNMAFDPSKFVP